MSLNDRMKLGFSAHSVHSILQKGNWVEIYKKELEFRLENLKKSKNNFIKGFFLKEIKPRLPKSDIEIRTPIQRWMQISLLKSFNLIRILNLIPEKLEKLSNIYEKYYNNPPIDNKRVIVPFSTINILNFLGIFVSELFFSIEAILRSICIGSCLHFAMKSLTTNIPIQHNEIFKTLKNLASNNKGTIHCKICPLKEECNNKSYLRLSAFYELSYHLRIIKDYHNVFYFTPGLLGFLEHDYLPKGFESLCILHEIEELIYFEYLQSPVSISGLRDLFSDELMEI